MYSLLGTKPTHKLDSNTACFISDLDLTQTNLQYLCDHQLNSKIILPAAAYIEIMLQAIAENYQEVNSYQLKQISIYAPLILSKSIKTHIKTEITQSNQNRKKRIAIYSSQSDHKAQTTWVLHAQSYVNKKNQSCDIGPISVELIKKHSKIIINNTQNKINWYKNIQRTGLMFGRTFQIIDQLWLGNNEILGKIRFDQNNVHAHVLYPVLLDACFQAVTARQISKLPPNSIHVPIAIQTLTINGSIKDSQYVYVTWPADFNKSSYQNNILYHDVYLLDQKGKSIAVVKNYTTKCITVTSI